MPPRFETDRGALVRRNPWIMSLAAAPFGLALVEIGLAIATGVPGALMFLPHLLALGTVFVLQAWRKNPWHREVPGRLAADERGVWHGGALLVPRDQIKSGFVLPRADGGPVVRFRRRGPRFPADVRVADREEGRALLRALGLDASQSVASFRLPSMAFGDPVRRRRYGAVVAGVMVLFAVLVGFVARAAPMAAPVFPFGMALLAMAAAALAAIPTRLQVGADGLHLRWLRSSRFIAYGEITAIQPYEEPGAGKNKLAGLMLTLRTGEAVRLPVQSKRMTVRDEIDILHERIAEAIDTWRRGEGAADAALVRRRGRAAPDWIRILQQIGTQANADARTAPVMPERLWRIVEDPSAPADARAGAAVALSRAAGGDARARLRAAASATAAPKLRIAIESAAESAPDEALAAALAEVESEEPEPRKQA